MTNSSMQIKAVIVDAVDPERLAGFWSEVLGRPVAGRTGPYVWLGRQGDLVVGFQQAEAPRPGKNRVHVDIASPDPAAEQRRIEALGGRRLHDYDDGGFLVMADLEGNEFCVIPDGPDGSVGLDDEGRAHYLDRRADGDGH
ncbi:VOC family protein [Streptomyces sp. NPDC056600]|uniref:VOC family protein n=1 Tax=Streptomyces sp. NPDC056600 TaxID=3345874 RepID=UPI0036986235